MNFKEYLKQLTNHHDVTFIIMKAVKDEHSPFYHDEYYQTPIRSQNEWLNHGDSILELQVINKDHCPIDVTGVWCNWYKKGYLNCCMVADTNYLRTRYNEKQAKDMEDYYNREVK